MATQKIWGFWLYLSRHMWRDETSINDNWVLQPPYFYPYKEENETDAEVWDETVQYIAKTQFNLVIVDVGDGMQYERHPEISAPDAWSKDFLKQKLDEMRSLGLEPIPKLNFSTAHDTWLKQYRRMVSSAPYYQACKDCIEEVCEVFGTPRFFHLGMDEERAHFQGNYDMCIVRSRDLWWHDVFFLFDVLEKQGVRPWMFGDLNAYEPDEFVKHMPHNILLTNWSYQPFRDYKPGSFTAPRLANFEALEKLGFDQVPCSSTFYGNYNNALEMMLHCNKVISPEHLTGYMTIPWFHTTRQHQYTLINDAYQFFRARRTLFPDSLAPNDIK